MSVPSFVLQRESFLRVFCTQLDLDGLCSLCPWSIRSVLCVMNLILEFAKMRNILKYSVFSFSGYKVLNSASPRSVMRNGFRKQYPEKLFHHPLLHLCWGECSIQLSSIHRRQLFSAGIKSFVGHLFVLVDHIGVHLHTWCHQITLKKVLYELSRSQVQAWKNK